MGYNPLTNGVYLGYNPLTNHLLNSWDIQVRNSPTAFCCMNIQDSLVAINDQEPCDGRFVGGNGGLNQDRTAR